MGQEQESVKRFLNDPQAVEVEMIGEIDHFCRNAYAIENDQIDTDGALIGSAIDSREFDDFASIGSIIDALAEPSQRTIFIDEVAPTSPFYQDALAVIVFVDALRLWINREIVSPRHTLAEAYDLLKREYGENRMLMQ